MRVATFFFKEMNLLFLSFIAAVGKFGMLLHAMHFLHLPDPGLQSLNGTTKTE